jgi:hypothetical protein
MDRLTTILSKCEKMLYQLKFVEKEGAMTFCCVLEIFFNGREVYE